MRKKQISTQWLLLLFTAFTFTSCEIYQEVKVKRVADFDLSELTNNHVAAVLRIGFENPNPYKITLFESDL
jgi:hypothetical protein